MKTNRILKSFFHNKLTWMKASFQDIDKKRRKDNKTRTVMSKSSELNTTLRNLNN